MSGLGSHRLAPAGLIQEDQEEEKERGGALCPIWLRDLDEALAKEAAAQQPQQLMPLATRPSYRKEEQGWTCIKAVPDTGAHASVAPKEMAPAWSITPSEGSIAGREFVSASGDPIPNLRQQTLPMQSPEWGLGQPAVADRPGDQTSFEHRGRV